MVSIEVAFQNVMKTSYTNVQFIQELDVLQKIQSILPYGSIGSIVPIHRSIQSVATPFGDLVPSDSSIPTEPLEVRAYSKLRQPALISPFNLFISQLSDTDQRQMIQKLFVIRQAIQAILFVFYTQDTIHPDRKTSLYFQIRNFFRSNQTFLTSNAIQTIISVFVFNHGKELQTFRTKLYNTLHNRFFLSFCVPNLKGSSATYAVSTLFFHIIGASTQINILQERVKLYMRYIVSFIKAPFMNEYKEQKQILSMAQVLALDTSIFVNPSYIREFRQSQQSTMRRRFYPYR